MTHPEPLSLLICGDICPTADTRALFNAPDPTALLGTLVERLRTADLSIANLECVLSETAHPADKIGPVLTGRAQDAQLLARAGFDLLGLANNHIKDCGPSGVLETLASCEAAGLRTTGAGRDTGAAAQPAVIDVKGWTIGIMAVAEHEFNAASATSPGAHVFDPLEDLQRLRVLKAKCDYVVVLYHGGIEYHPYPSPLLQRTCRALVRNGADLVLCQHSHVIGTFENYEGGHILYGQGNTVFGHRHGKPSWNEGLVVSVKLERLDTVCTQISLLPIQCDTNGAVDLMEEAQAKACIEDLRKRSNQAKDHQFVQAIWSKFCKQLSKNQLPHLLGWGLWMTRINRLLGGKLVQILYTRKQRMTSLNVVRCDAHREVILTSIETDYEMIADQATKR